MYVKGLLEMMFEVQSEWIDTFIDDMESLAAAEGMHSPVQPSGSGQPGSHTPPSSANTSPRGSHHIHTPSGRQLWSPCWKVPGYLTLRRFATAKQLLRGIMQAADPDTYPVEILRFQI